MTPQQIQIIQTTWAQVVPIADTAAGLFYGKLFELDPAVKPMFKGDMAEQGRKLMQTLGLVVNSLTTLDQILPAVQELAKRHVDYGVEAKHYDTVGAALLWTLGQGLGPAFTPEAETAWTEAYGTVAKVMKDAAYS